MHSPDGRKLKDCFGNEHLHVSRSRLGSNVIDLVQNGINLCQQAVVKFEHGTIWNYGESKSFEKYIFCCKNNMKRLNTNLCLVSIFQLMLLKEDCLIRDCQVQLLSFPGSPNPRALLHLSQLQWLMTNLTMLKRQCLEPRTQFQKRHLE